jgi:dihydroflavonol-4-reductase
MAASPLVLVSGATGYIGAQIVAHLLAAGYRVRGSVRSLDEAKLAPLRRLVGPTGHRVEFCAASLSSADGWVAAVRGCSYVQHVASPLPVGNTPADPEETVIRPAVDGVRHVFAAALAEPSVRRIVYMGSIAAVMGDREALRLNPKHVYSAADWTRDDFPGVRNGFGFA